MNEFLDELTYSAESFATKIEFLLGQISHKFDLSFPDHVCYRVATDEQYETYKSKLDECGVLLVESLVSGRNIATYKLATPLQIFNAQVDIIELPAPKQASSYGLGFEHVEFVTTISFAELQAEHEELNWDTRGSNKSFNPELRLILGEGLSIKFHHQSLEKVIEIEKNQL